MIQERGMRYSLAPGCSCCCRAVGSIGRPIGIRTATVPVRRRVGDAIQVDVFSPTGDTTAGTGVAGLAGPLKWLRVLRSLFMSLGEPTIGVVLPVLGPTRLRLLA